jgi:hypothetical protein
MPTKVKPAYVEKIEVVPSQDKLDAIRDKLRRARDLQLKKAELTAQLETVQKEILKIEQQELPDLAQDAHIDSLGLEPEGNLPGYDMEIKPYYYANIKDEEPTAPQAYAWLSKAGHGDLIKYTYTVLFGLGEKKESIAFAKLLTKSKVQFNVKLGVPWNTLTAFLKEQVEGKKTIPPLDLMNGKIGIVAKIKARK